MPVSPTLSHLVIQQVFIEYLLCAWHCYNHYEYIMMKTEIRANKAFVWTSSLVMKQMRPQDYSAAPLLFLKVVHEAYERHRACKSIAMPFWYWLLFYKPAFHRLFKFMCISYTSRQLTSGQLVSAPLSPPIYSWDKEAEAKGLDYDNTAPWKSMLCAILFDKISRKRLWHQPRVKELVWALKNSKKAQEVYYNTHKSEVSH